MSMAGASGPVQGAKIYRPSSKLPKQNVKKDLPACTISSAVKFKSILGYIGVQGQARIQETVGKGWGRGSGDERITGYSL